MNSESQAFQAQCCYTTITAAKQCGNIGNLYKMATFLHKILSIAKVIKPFYF